MSERRSWIRTTAIGLVLSALLVATVGWLAWAYYFEGAARLGPQQPIPFSHRVHATDKDIDCRFCHTGVDRVNQAGIPTVETCLFCHRVVITEHPEIRRLRWHFEHDEPVPWARVFEVPDHVYFSHRVHLGPGGLQCGDCHGPVEQMERLEAPRVFEMGFCLDCHRPRGASTDCWACHQ